MKIYKRNGADLLDLGDVLKESVGYGEEVDFYTSVLTNVNELYEVALVVRLHGEYHVCGHVAGHRYTTINIHYSITVNVKVVLVGWDLIV